MLRRRVHGVEILEERRQKVNRHNYSTKVSSMLSGTRFIVIVVVEEILCAFPYK